MIGCQKDHFQLPDDLHYLNCAYMAPRSRQVEQAGIEAIRRDRVPTQVPPQLFFSESGSVRSLFAELIHADPGRIALVPSVSYGIATVANNTRLSGGDNVVVMHEQFPSNVYAWRRLAGRTGAEIRTVRAPENRPDRGRAWNERILESIDSRTRVVAMGQVHWTDGTLFDLEAIGRRARDVDAALIVDGTQSVGALPFDVSVLRPDAVICAGYKWLLGPYSLGAAYYGPRFDDGDPVEDSWITRAGSEDFSGLVSYQNAFQPGAIRFDMGERSNFILAPMLHAALSHLLEWGVETVQQYCAQLTRDMIREAANLGFRIEEDAWRAAHLFGIRLPESVSMDRLQRELTSRNVVVSVRGNALRVSPHLYNDERDIDRLLDALRAASGIGTAADRQVA